MINAVISIVLLLSLSAAPALAEEDPLSPSGLPLPRFVSLKADEANMRAGPGLRYPIRWVYHQEHLPLEIIEEFYHWRKVRDSDGTAGWMHRSMLSGERHALVTAREQILRSGIEEASRPIARIEQGVLVALLRCQQKMCEITTHNHKGWVPKEALWGVYFSEIF